MDYIDKIDPELRKSAKSMPFGKQIVRMGNVYMAAAWKLTKTPNGISVKTIETEGYQNLKFKTDIFTPDDVSGPMPALIYVHGGAFCFKGAVYHKNMACIYAAKAKCKVFVPDFHLAPEHPYPAAITDVKYIYKYVMEHAEELEVDVSRIGIAGDSSGATIAALVCNQYERNSLVKPCLQMLIYPLTDDDMHTESMEKYTDAPNWNPGNMPLTWALYFGEQDENAFKDGIRGVLKDEVIEGALPMHSVLPAEIPNTYIETTEVDCLHDEGILYASRLREAGANVEINDTKGTFHGYDMSLDKQIVIDNVKKRISFLRRNFLSRG